MTVGLLPPGPCQLCGWIFRPRASVGAANCPTVRRRAFSDEAVLGMLRNEPLRPTTRLNLSDRPKLLEVDNGVRPAGVYDQLLDGESVATCVITRGDNPFARVYERSVAQGTSPGNARVSDRCIGGGPLAVLGSIDSIEIEITTH